MNKQDIYEVTFSSSEIVILGDYLKTIDSPAFPANRKNQSGGTKNKKTNGNQENKNDIDWNQYAKEFCGYFVTITNNNTTTKITNLQKILNRFSYNPNQVSNIQSLINAGNYLDISLKPGIKFAIPIQNVDRATLLTQGLQVVTNDGAFKAKALYDLERDLRYTPLISQTPNQALVGSLKELYPDLTVWLWCRSLSPENVSDKTANLTGQIFDITRFITNITTNMGKNGGNFNIQLAPIVCKRDNTNGYWSIDYAYFQESQNMQAGRDYFSETQLNKIVSGTDIYSYQTARNTFFFHNSINTNDVIFIRHEPLQIENQQRINDSQKVMSFVDKNDLPGKIFDMIGLVDANRLIVSPNNNDIVIQIDGRDLSKLFIEDGTYFYALENKQGLLNFAGGTSAKNDLTRRIIGDNSLLYLSLYFNNSIENILEFIIQQLSTIGVVPDDLFSGYGVESVINPMIQTVDFSKPNQLTQDQRNKQFKLGQDSKAILKQRQRKVKDDINNVKSLIKNFRKTNNISTKSGDGEFDQYKDNEDVDNIYYQLEGFINTITNTDPQNHKVAAQFSSSSPSNVFGATNTTVSRILSWDSVTYGAYVTEANKIPSIFFESETALFPAAQQGTATRENENIGIINGVWNIIQENRDLNKNLKNQEVLASGIWQIIDLVIDKGVSERRVLDSSISSANGSLLNFIRKICQEPFVEFFMDTYNDRYYLVVRKPPFDRDGMIKYITGDVYTENQVGTDKVNVNEGTFLPQQYDAGHPLVMEIKDVDVISENLIFDDSDVYSWYHFTPKGSFFGNSDQFSLAYIPAIFFEEYATIWGSKPMDIINNYVPYIPNYTKNTHQLDLFSKQACYDLKYMIETNQYNPFVRKGSITVNRDRRLKIGNPVRYLPTGEIFWIESVTHNTSITDHSIDATTTISVSHGMVEKFIQGITGEELNNLFPTNNKLYTPTQRFSYFDIIGTELLFKYKKVPIYKTVNSTTEINNDQVIVGSSDRSTGQTSTRGVQFIKDHEGQPDLIARYDVNGYALGYGSHYNTDGTKIKKGQRTNLQGAEDLLRFTLYRYETDVTMCYFPKPLLQNQFDALVDYSYNHGHVDVPMRKMIVSFQKGLISAEQLTAFWTKAFITVPVLNPITNKPIIDPLTNKAKRIISPTLQRRRLQEVELFLNKIVVLGTTAQDNEKQVFDHFEKVIDFEQVFNNFVVNKEVFNFFLRRQQLDYFAATNNNINNLTPQETSQQQVVDMDNNFHFKRGKI